MQLVIVEDEVERITGELTEARRLLAKRDSQLKDLGSEVNRLRSGLEQSEVCLISSTVFGEIALKIVMGKVKGVV